MKINQTFKNNLPIVFLVGTPIGNLDDFSNRAIRTLNDVEIICCEDTRTSKILLSKYNISSKLISLHKFNELDRVEEINKYLLAGKNIAIISDAGAPVISDPGAVFIKQLQKINNNFNTTAINVGPAYIHAIVASGFTNKNNAFFGFIESKSEQSKYEELTKIITKYNNEMIISFYESVHRIKSTILTLSKILNPNQNIVVARELTKINEELIFGTIEEVCEYINSPNFIEKGEFVIVIDQFNISSHNNFDDQKVFEEMEKYISQGFKTKQASEIVSNISGIKKNEIYKIYLEKIKNS